MKWLVPQIVQTSQMDCGPAALAAVAEGLGVHLNYGSLREACQTSVAGTSIDTIQEIARQFGLDADQIMLPAEHITIPEAMALPAIVVAKQPTGALHYVVVWRCVGDFVQLMDPITGRRWVRRRAFCRHLFLHEHPVGPSELSEFVRSSLFLSCLERRMRAIGVAASDTMRHFDALTRDDDWYPIVALDASVRLAAAIFSECGIKRGAESTAAVVAALRRALAYGRKKAYDALPKDYWFATEVDGGARVRGAVLVRFARAAPTSSLDDLSVRYRVAPNLARAIRASTANPLSVALRTVVWRNRGTFFGIIVATALGAFMALVQAILLRAAANPGGLPSEGVRVAFVVLLLVWIGASLALNVATGALGARLGRRLEGSLRMELYRKLAVLEAQYLQSRLTSDMAERAHMLHVVASIPAFVQHIVQSVAMLLGTSAAVLFLDPSIGVWGTALALSAVVLPLIGQPLIVERDLKFRTYQGAVMRHYLDAMLGHAPIRAHTGERIVRREHEGFVAELTRAGRDLLSLSVLLDFLLGMTAIVITGGLLWAHFHGHVGGAADALLMVFWVLQIPTHGKQVAAAVRQYPSLRNVLLRIFEPLTASEVSLAEEAEPGHQRSTGLPIELNDVGLEVGGVALLRNVTAAIPSGKHVAIVGPSGAGKSTLLGLLLGWHLPTSGALTIDGQPMTPSVAQAVRQTTAWVDPQVMLWNQSLLDNVRFGAWSSSHSVADALDRSLLLPLMESLPEGLSTRLGEGGGLLSGGEGQRVRLARAWLRKGARLVLLDEPFRGLAKDQRATLLHAARDHWHKATLICATHDVRETTEFDLVMVVEDGRLVEFGDPASLLATASRYRAVVDAEIAKAECARKASSWRHIEFVDGRPRQVSR